MVCCLYLTYTSHSSAGCVYRNWYQRAKLVTPLSPLLSSPLLFAFVGAPARCLTHTYRSTSPEIQAEPSRKHGGWGHGKTWVKGKWKGIFTIGSSTVVAKYICHGSSFEPCVTTRDTPNEIHPTCTCCATKQIACSRFQHRSSAPQLVQLLQTARRCGRCRTSSGLSVHAQRWPKSIAAAEPVDSTSFVPLPTSSRLYLGHLVVMTLPHLRLTGIQRRCTRSATRQTWSTT